MTIEHFKIWSPPKWISLEGKPDAQKRKELDEEQVNRNAKWVVTLEAIQIYYYLKQLISKSVDLQFYDYIALEVEDEEPSIIKCQVLDVRLDYIKDLGIDLLQCFIYIETDSSNYKLKDFQHADEGYKINVSELWRVKSSD